MSNSKAGKDSTSTEPILMEFDIAFDLDEDKIQNLAIDHAQELSVSSGEPAVENIAEIDAIFVPKNDDDDNQKSSVSSQPTGINDESSLYSVAHLIEYGAENQAKDVNDIISSKSPIKIDEIFGDDDLTTRSEPSNVTVSGQKKYHVMQHYRHYMDLPTKISLKSAKKTSQFMVIKLSALSPNLDQNTVS